MSDRQEREKGEDGFTSLQELGDEDKELVMEVFYREIVPKLLRLDARNGVLCCDFAGPQFRAWQVRFRSKGADFEIVDFEYDEEGCGIDLDL